jgi:hypothetical protein
VSVIENRLLATGAEKYHTPIGFSSWPEN